ncbi:glycoside hydrolase/phage tail family protein [uncultured Brevundimonas sp.]|uniref:baseplate multidomain protein megatron n=1 Tax=uncultured Brevundimonas sp. TaxID=213418 RepID=UPI0025F93A8B|nr:glycoside hydrolase/phage tail family protein [uncultured Brevundimonas sp.]
MATLVLNAVGTAIGGPIGGQIGSAIGSMIDSYAATQLFGSYAKQEGPRLDTVQVQASTEGAALPEIAGAVRLAGQIIWATNFKETATTQKQGGKGGSKGVQTTSYAYSVSFAVALCEGVIDSVGRVWADGKPMDLTGVTMRVYRGDAVQEPDSLIEGIEGAGKAPAYRGTAYVVFDNLALADFGNRIPQLTFEVFRTVGGAASLEDLAKAVCVIPGGGERVYDTVIQRRYSSLTVTTAENNATGKPASDFTVSMDDLETRFPNADTALLVVGWFGSDLRCGVCDIRPKVEFTAKNTIPDSWRVHGVERADAQVVSDHDGTPAYGGAPSDDSVVRAIRDLKARGFNVILYPFVFMDVPTGNTLPNPYGGTGQPAYPWRGRITCHPAVGVAGTVDKTATAATQVNAFFGSVTASQVAVAIDGDGQVATTYTGPSEWSYRRFILHYARLAAAINAVDAGAVGGFLVGSELRGLTQVRSSATAFPAVAKLKALAADAKGIVGAGVKVSYAADWSDYNGYKPDDGSGDFFNHLDPIWSDSSVDFIGVDNYVPLSDWRAGKDHIDAASYDSIYDPAYLADNIEGGETYDWFYASPADRAAQVRTPITDGAYSKPWVFRAKDFRNWWLNSHRDRIAGVESGSATAWTPQSKPIWFTEFGVPSVDKGTNQPNVFYDPKSSESFFPYFSKGSRDDLIQRRGLEAFLNYWNQNNPVSTVYGGPMIGQVALWCWDARPYPAWPARSDIWGDTDLFPLGHWLKGGGGFSDLATLVAERCARVGFYDVDVSALNGVVQGYLRDRPMSPRAEIEMLMTAFGFDAVESEAVIRFVPRGRPSVAALTEDDLVEGSSEAEPMTLVRGQETDLPDTVSISFTDPNKEYQSGTATRTRLAGYSDRVANTAVPLVMDETQAQGIADRLLPEAWIGRDTAQFALPPSMLAVEPTDVVDLMVGGQARGFRIVRISDQGARMAEAVRAEDALYGVVLPGIAPPILTTPPVYGPAELRIMDLPLLADTDNGAAPYAAAMASPWAGVAVMDSATGADFALDTLLTLPATMGETVDVLQSGPLDLWDRANILKVQLYTGELTSLTEETILAGRGNALAVQTGDDWEIIQFADATLIGDRLYELRTLLRGRLGTEPAMVGTLALGASVVLLNGAVAQLDVALAERSISRAYTWGPPSLPMTDAAWRSASYTARAMGLTPWAPTLLAGVRSAGDLVMSWVRRTRFGGVWTDGTDVPLNEETEAYQVDVMSGATVVRTLAVTTPTATYTAAQQTTDFGAPQASIAVRIYQMSATVGRGRAALATL